MTEDEAKTKWCCGPKIISDQMLANRLIPARIVNPADLNGTCVASGCMAWRATDNEGGPWSPDEGTQPVSKPAGYCGLAGRP